MFKQASKMKLRFATSKGNLSVEDLWDLSLTELLAKKQSEKMESMSEDEIRQRLAELG